MHESDDAHDALGPSRSHNRRAALDVFDLAEQLATLSDAQLESVPLTADLLDEVRRTRETPQHIARKRQTQFLAKQLRKEDEDAIDAIRLALTHSREQAHRQTALLHRLEIWRDRLIAEGDAALEELIALHPQADRQHLRQLVRQAKLEAQREKPPRAARELFRALRGLFGVP